MQGLTKLYFKLNNDSLSFQQIVLLIRVRQICLFFVLKYNIMKQNQIEYQQFLINGWENKEGQLQQGQNNECDRQNSKNRSKQNPLLENKILPFKEDKVKKIQKHIFNSSMPKIITKKQPQNYSKSFRIVKSSLKLSCSAEGNHLQPIPFQTNNENSFAVKLFPKQHKSFHQQQPEIGTPLRTQTEGLQRYNLFSRHHQKIRNQDQPANGSETRESLFKKMQKCCLVESKTSLIFKEKKLKMHSINSQSKSKMFWRKPSYLPFAYREAIQKYYKEARPKQNKHLHENNISKHPAQQQFQRYSLLQSRS